jgi:hypothetical protein
VSRARISLALALVTACYDSDNTASGEARTYRAAQAPVDTVIKAMARERVVHQFIVESALSTTGPVAPDSFVSLAEVQTTIPGIRVWRALVLIHDHSHPYLVAQVGDSVVPLGGFPSPALLSVAPPIDMGATGDSAIVATARSLALLADPNGAMQVVFPEMKASSRGAIRIRNEWERRRPSNWPKYRIEQSPLSGQYLVVVTALSREVRSFAQEWVPFVYAFGFTPSGRLSAWMRMPGPAFATPGLDVSVLDTIPY